MNNFCHNCGHKLVPNANFCAQCGTAIRATTLPQQQVNLPSIPSVPAHAIKTYHLDRFGRVSIDYSQRTLHLELYEEKVSGIIFRSRVRGKCIINKTLNFSQLVNYKIIDTFNSYRASAWAEKFAVKNVHDFKLGIELYIDDAMGYYFVNFGYYPSFGTLPPKEYNQAKIQLGTLVSALETVKQNV